MNIATISSNVQALLTDTGYFVTVLPSPPESGNDFAGYPSASHYYENTSSQYATVSQNRRTIQYIVELYIVPNKATPFQDLLPNEAYPLIDNVIQMFDVSRDLSSTSIPLARACDMLHAAPGELIRIEQKDGDGVMMTIRLTCEGDTALA